MKDILKQVGISVIVFVIIFILQETVIINARIPSESMEGTIMTGDRLFGNRLAYIEEKPKRGDIIIFKYPDNPEEQFIKRVIGLPGEHVQIINSSVYIDGKLIEEDYLKEEWVVANNGYDFDVPEKSYFVMGDNRNNSMDSRYWENPFVTEDLIIAKAELIYYPITEAGFVE